MFRAAVPLILLAALTSSARAQPRQLPLSPGVTPGTLNSPGITVPVRGLPQPSPGSGILYFPTAVPGGWGVGWGYQSYSPWNNYSFIDEGILPAGTVPTAAPVERTVVLAREFPATLAIQFPAAAEVWFDGKKVDGSAKEEQVLTSPVLKPTQTYTFLVKARWEKGGKTYETKRTITLGPGDHGRLLVVSGDEVRE